MVKLFQFIGTGVENQVKVNAIDTNKETTRIRTPSTTIAEEAVDQLQASEKLIAGKMNLKVAGTNVLC